MWKGRCLERLAPAWAARAPCACCALSSPLLAAAFQRSLVVAVPDVLMSAQGAYGEVVQLRKKKGGALYAAKKFTNGERGRLRQPAVLTYALLAELRAMMKARCRADAPRTTPD